MWHNARNTWQAKGSGVISKLPRWVEVGGFSLAFNAGFINAIALLGFKHQAVSHLTGTSTFLSLAIATADTRKIVLYLILIAGFISGGVGGSVAYATYGFSAMLGPGLITALIALAHLLYWHKALQHRSGR